MQPKNTKKLTREDAISRIESVLSAGSKITSSRKASFTKYKTHVDGIQWTEKEEPENDDPKLVFNLAEDVVNTYQSKLFPRNQLTGVLEIGVKSKSILAEKRGSYETHILSSYLDADFNEVLLEQGENFLVGGSACLYYPQDPITGEVVIGSLDPTTVCLAWKGRDLIAFTFCEEFSLDGVTIEKITYWDNQYQIVKEGEDIVVTENKHGFIPFSWIPCRPRPHRHEGRSPINSLIMFDKEINFRSSDYSKRIRENTQPERAIYSQLDTSEIVRDNSNTHHLAQNDRMENLVVPEGTATLEWIEKMRSYAQMKSGLNDSVMGKIKANTSGVSIAYQMAPIMDRIGFFRVHWDKAFRALNRAILFYKYGGSYDSSEYNTDPVYNPAMPADLQTLSMYYEFMLRNKLISHADAIDDLRGSQSAEEMLQRVLLEMENYPNLYQASGTKVPPVSKN